MSSERIPDKTYGKFARGMSDISRDPPLTPAQAAVEAPGNHAAYVDEERVSEAVFVPEAGLADRQAGRS